MCVCECANVFLDIFKKENMHQEKPLGLSCGVPCPIFQNKKYQKETNNAIVFYKLLVQVDLWEKLLLATDSHDLTIDTAEGPVTAHTQMLKEASPAPRLSSYPRKPCDPIVLYEQISRVSGC